MKTKIVVRNGIAIIPAKPSELLYSALGYEQRKYHPESGLVPAGPLRMYRVNDGGGITIPIGLLDRCLRILQLGGWTVEIEDETDYRSLQQSPKSTLPLGDLVRQQREFIISFEDPNDRKLLRDVVNTFCRQILCAPERSPLVAATIADLFSDSGVAVVCRNRDEARQTFEGIRRVSRRPVVLHPDRAWDAGMRRYFVVGPHTIGELAHVQDFQVLIFIGIEPAIAARTWRNIIEFNQEAFRYCLHAGRRTMSMGEQLFLEVACGPLPASGNSVSDVVWDVEVIPLAFRHANCPVDTDTFDFKRDHIWLNDERNEFIVDIARRAVDGTLNVDKEKSSGGASRHSVAILVETPGQGEAILRRLGDWTLLAIDGSPEYRTRPIENKFIVTQAHAHSQGFSAEIVIRADGSRGWPLDDPAKWRSASGYRLVIDIEDRPRRAFRKSKRRTPLKDF